MAKDNSATVQVHKVTLSTGKIVHLKDPKIRHQELAMKAIGDKAGSNQAYMGILIQKELVKILLYQVDGKKPSGIELENLDELFSLKEYSQLNSAVSQLIGTGGEEGELQIESEFVGGK